MACFLVKCVGKIDLDCASSSMTLALRVMVELAEVSALLLSTR